MSMTQLVGTEAKDVVRSLDELAGLIREQVRLADEAATLGRYEGRSSSSGSMGSLKTRRRIAGPSVL